MLLLASLFDTLANTAALFSDPVFADLVFTVVVSVALVLGAVVSLAMLPWTDREIEQVDASFKKSLGAVVARVSSRERVAAPRRAA